VRGTSTYLAGERHYQVWAPPESAEQRLMVARNADGSYDETTYDHQVYEEQMFWFNSVYRPRSLGQPFANYDLARTADILAKYLDASSDADVIAFMLLMDTFFVDTHGRKDTSFARTFLGNLGSENLTSGKSVTPKPPRPKGVGRVFVRK
jgi:hypothetical protein